MAERTSTFVRGDDDDDGDDVGGDGDDNDWYVKLSACVGNLPNLTFSRKTNIPGISSKIRGKKKEEMLMHVKVIHTYFLTYERELIIELTINNNNNE